MWSLGSNKTSLNLSFLIHKMEIVTCLRGLWRLNEILFIKYLDSVVCSINCKFCSISICRTWLWLKIIYIFKHTIEYIHFIFILKYLIDKYSFTYSRCTTWYIFIITFYKIDSILWNHSMLAMEESFKNIHSDFAIMQINKVICSEIKWYHRGASI